MSARTDQEIAERMQLAALVIDKGACTKTNVDPDIFYPVVHGGRRRPGDPDDIYAEARAICERCPVREACLDLAEHYGTRHGMWGGLDPDERAARRRRLAQEANDG